MVKATSKHKNFGVFFLSTKTEQCLTFWQIFFPETLRQHTFNQIQLHIFLVLFIVLLAKKHYMTSYFTTLQLNWQMWFGNYFRCNYGTYRFNNIDLLTLNILFSQHLRFNTIKWGVNNACFLIIWLKRQTNFTIWHLAVRNQRKIIIVVEILSF